jgi:hypothetical protein
MRAPAPAPLGAEVVLAQERATLRPDPATADQPLSALCISGGGIRSATFALGVIQGLAERGLLPQFDYLSTVSGGGYIGSWLVAWINRAGGLDRIIPFLRRGADPAPGVPDPILHLREYNSYLSPKRGLFSFDVWALAATIGRNIILNWVVLVPLMMAALMLPRVYLSVLAFPEWRYGGDIFIGDVPHYETPVLDVISQSVLVTYVLPLASAFLLAMALFNTLRYLPGVGGRAHASYDVIRTVLAPLFAAVLLFLAFDSLYYLGGHYDRHNNLVPVVTWMVASALLALLAYLVTCGKSVARCLRDAAGLSKPVFAMAAGTGLAAWVTTNFVLWDPDSQVAPTWGAYVTFGPPFVLGGFCLGTVLFVGLSSRFLQDEDREWMSRFVGGVMMLGLSWLAVGACVLLAPGWIIEWNHAAHAAIAAAGGLTGWIATFGRWSMSSSSSSSGSAPARSTWKAILPKIATPIFVVLVAIGLSFLTDLALAAVRYLPASRAARLAVGVYWVDETPVLWTYHHAILTRSSLISLAILAVILPAVSTFMARYININIFSLHGMYRDRLVRAYLGASNRHRHSNAFTGFAASDDLEMTALDTSLRPMPVVNLTLNLVAGDRLDWQQRKAQPFTVTPLACGNSDLGYRPSSHYGGRRGITLGTAAAISGAAASPNMGYNSSPSVTFLMTLLNARLGCWLGNPGPTGSRTWTDSGPKSAIRSLVAEALGITSNRSDYVYLSDGGHFENLAIYEMVRRRCHVITVLDGGCDPDSTLEDLGNALRKIRIDFRLPIEFNDAQIAEVRARRRRCAVARISYSSIDPACADGYLLYVKAVATGNEPPDVQSYRVAHPTFPHQSTANQWFDESQTESYRVLGLHTVDDIVHGWHGGTLEELCRYLETSDANIGGTLATAGV